MTTFYSIDDANATLTEIEPILEGLRDERQELIRLRDRALAGRADGGDASEVKAEERRLRLKMQGLIDQMQAGVMRLDELSVTLRDIESGLIDFPALVAGRQVWLCWRLGEGPIEFWHELETGFASRQRLIDLA
ncbi:MAG: DUF2203 domain-containing protein [Chloroflexi bacterium]|nr:DUF2203 domain-containing protein [Chloroflexota bacterium]